MKLEYTLFYIRTYNFGAEAERSYYFWQFEPEKFLRYSEDVLKLSVIVFP